MRCITPTTSLLLFLLLPSCSFLSSPVQATYTPLLPPFPPPGPDEEPYALIRLNDRIDINITRNDYLSQTKSLTLPGALPLPEYEVSPEWPIDELPGLDITSAELLSSMGVRAPFGFFLWSSSEENFVTPVVTDRRPFLPAGRSSSSSTTTTNNDPLSSNDDDADDDDDDDDDGDDVNGEDTDPNANDPPNQLDRRTFFPAFSSSPSSRFSYAPIPQSAPFYAAERISFLIYSDIEVFVFVEVLPENTIDGRGSGGDGDVGGGNAVNSNPDAGRRRRGRVIPEIRTSLWEIRLEISFFRSFGRLGNRGSGYSRFKIPPYARNIRRIAIVKGPADGSRCEIEVARKKFAEFAGPGGDGREPSGRASGGGGGGGGGQRGRRRGRGRGRAPEGRTYLKGPIYGATALVCYGIFPEGYAN